jgi:hypothetical protein
MVGTLVIAIGTFIVVLGSLVFLRSRDKRYEIKVTDLENPDETFFGTIDARLLNGMLTASNPTISSSYFANLLGTADRKGLSDLPGFVSADHAMHVKDDKRRALQEMEVMNVDTLPVVDGENRYQGIVNRSRLTASLILDVAEAVAK